jgi:hypothetical protein
LEEGMQSVLLFACKNGVFLLVCLGLGMALFEA